MSGLRNMTEQNLYHCIYGVGSCYILMCVVVQIMVYDMKDAICDVHRTGGTSSASQRQQSLL